MNACMRCLDELERTIRRSLLRSSFRSFEGDDVGVDAVEGR